jgi:hypothetical protein
MKLPREFLRRAGVASLQFSRREPYPMVGEQVKDFTVVLFAVLLRVIPEKLSLCFQVVDP